MHKMRATENKFIHFELFLIWTQARMPNDNLIILWLLKANLFTTKEDAGH